MTLKNILKEECNTIPCKVIRVGAIVLIGFVSIFVFIFSILKGIQESQTISNKPTNIQNSIEFNNQLSIKSNENDHVFEVSIADNDEKRASGLMNVKKLKDNQGMLFIFENETELSFWMKNTYIPLDIIFIDSDFTITTIHENTVPLDTSNRYDSSGTAKYALELNGGTTKEKNIEVGDKLIIKN